MSERRLRVLVLTSTFPRWPGDSQPPFVYNLSSRLAKRFDVTVLAPHGPNCKSREVWDGMQVRRFRYFWPERLEQLAYGGILPNLRRNRLLWFLVPFFMVSELITAFSVARTERVDVLHAHWLVPQGVVAVLVGWLTRRPVLATCHAADLYGLRGRFRDRIKRWTLARCSHITTVSNDLMEEVRGLRVNPKIPSAVISMGVDTQVFHPIKADPSLAARFGTSGPLLLFVGRLVEKKGVEYLLRAMPRVLSHHPDATAVVVGDGPLGDELRGLAGRLEVLEHVRFVGATPQDELPAYYATATVFVAPSMIAEGGDREGLPVVALEAMASGCPVVASDVGGTGEVVVHNETGLLVRERDPEGLAEAICGLLEDESLREGLSGRALARVRERFDQQVVSDRFGEVIASVGKMSS